MFGYRYIWPKGIWLKAIGTKGIWPKGIWPKGIWPYTFGWKTFQVMNRCAYAAGQQVMKFNRNCIFNWKLWRSITTQIRRHSYTGCTLAHSLMLKSTYVNQTHQLMLGKSTGIQQMMKLLIRYFHLMPNISLLGFIPMSSHCAVKCSAIVLLPLASELWNLIRLNF